MVFGNCSGLERETKRKTLEREKEKGTEITAVCIRFGCGLAID